MSAPGQDRLVDGDFTEPRTDDLNAPVEWRGLPAFVPVTRDVRLVLTFDDEAGRDELIEQLGLVIAKKTGKTWSAWWPPRDRDDLSALRFDFDAPADQQGEPDPEPGGVADEDWTPAPDEEVPASWAEHVGHQVALTYGYDGALIGARCSSCGVDLPPPDAVETIGRSPLAALDDAIAAQDEANEMGLSPEPEPADVVSDTDAGDAAQDQQTAEDEADSAATSEPPPDDRLLGRGPSAYDPFAF